MPRVFQWADAQKRNTANIENQISREKYANTKRKHILYTMIQKLRYTVTANYHKVYKFKI